MQRQAGRWRTRDEVASLTVPESVQSVIVSRVDRLEPVARRVIRTASVIGRSFPRRLLAHLAGEDARSSALSGSSRAGG